jgi:hypothetical protein
MDFPQGPWTGFYNYGRSTRKHRMDLGEKKGDQDHESAEEPAAVEAVAVDIWV